MPSSFEKLRSINVSHLTAKKGKLDYLPWTHAWNELLKHYPNATYTLRNWPLIIFGKEGPIWMESTEVPYLVSPEGYMVEVSVDLNDGETPVRHADLFVMDTRNKAIRPGPYYGEGADMFDINKTVQRCLVKAIAMCGLGLDIYTKEDNPLDPSDVDPPELDAKEGVSKKARELEKKHNQERSSEVPVETGVKGPWANRQECLNQVKKLKTSEEVNKWLAQYWVDAMSFFNKKDISILEKDIKSFRDGLKATEELQTETA